MTAEIPETKEEAQLKLLDAALQIAQAAFVAGTKIGMVFASCGLDGDQAGALAKSMVETQYGPKWRADWLARMKMN